jgi:hypothetical protein
MTGFFLSTFLIRSLLALQRAGRFLRKGRSTRQERALGLPAGMQTARLIQRLIFIPMKLLRI